MRTILNKISRRGRWLWNDYYYRFKSGAYWNAQRGKAIFIYHGVDHVGSLKYNTRFISQDTLEAQLKFFKKHFHIASIQDYVSGNFPKDKFTVTLTFDDGYRNNFDLALPILEKYQVPACFFVTSIQSAGYDILWSDHLDLGFQFSESQLEIDGRLFVKGKHEFFEKVSGISLKNVCRNEGFGFKKKMLKKISDEFRSKEDLSIYWQLMDAKLLKTMNESPLVTIGSHGHFHDNYDNISEQEGIDDLSKSKAYLEDALEREVGLLAYPDGSYNRQTIENAEKLGYSHQFAVDYTNPEDVADRRVFDRFGLNPYIGVEHQAKAMIDGGY